jgi:hypothetical protein
MVLQVRIGVMPLERLYECKSLMGFNSNGGSRSIIIERLLVPAPVLGTFSSLANRTRALGTTSVTQRKYVNHDRTRIIVKCYLPIWAIHTLERCDALVATDEIGRGCCHIATPVIEH